MRRKQLLGAVESVCHVYHDTGGRGGDGERVYASYSSGGEVDQPKLSLSAPPAPTLSPPRDNSDLSYLTVYCAC